MKKRLAILLIVIGMLIGAGGCSVVTPILLTPICKISTTVLAMTFLNLGLDAPVEYKGGAWFIEPNEPLDAYEFTEYVKIKIEKY